MQLNANLKMSDLHLIKGTKQNNIPAAVWLKFIIQRRYRRQICGHFTLMIVSYRCTQIYLTSQINVDLLWWMKRSSDMFLMVNGERLSKTERREEKRKWKEGEEVMREVGWSRREESLLTLIPTWKPQWSVVSKTHGHRLWDQTSFLKP